MKFEEILTNLKNQKYSPVYFFMGEEPYFMDVLTQYIADHALEEKDRAFNQTIVYGKDTNVHDIITQARKFPMMATHQLVIVKEAQELKNIDDLIYYVEKPLKSTILVINYKYKKISKQKKLIKAVQKNGILFESTRLYDNQIPEWIQKLVKKKGKDIDMKAAVLLSEYLGANLNKISNEVDKLLLTLPSNDGRITVEHIERNIGISKDFNVFELQNVLGAKNSAKAYQIIDYFAQNQKEHPITLTIITLFNFFSKVLIYHTIAQKSQKEVASILKVPPFFVRDYQRAARNYSKKKLVRIINALREYDLRSKGVNNRSIPPGELLKELVYVILH